MAMIIAKEFHLKHCGIISGMVPAKEYFVFADSTFTKPLMKSVLAGPDEFQKTIESFPNVAEILKQANSPLPAATRASFDDLNFILTKTNFNNKAYKKLKVDWLHGENDKNVALQSVLLFLSKFKKAELTVIPNADHSVDGRIPIRQLLDKWPLK